MANEFERLSAPPGAPMLSGMTRIDQGMFGGGPVTGGEDEADAMEKARQRALVQRKVRMTGVHVKTFDMSVDKDVKEYEKLLLKLLAEQQKMECNITVFDRKFVEVPSPRWLIHMHWVTFKMESTATAPIAGEKK